MSDMVPLVWRTTMNFPHRTMYMRLGVAMAVAFSLGSGAVSEAYSDTAGGQEGEWYVSFPETGNIYHPSTIGGSDTGSAGDSSVNLLDPIDWANCHVFQNETHVIDSFEYYWNGSSKQMGIQCGKAENPRGQGYFHISFGHETQWRDRITQVGGGNTDAWDNLMWIAAVESLLATYDSSGGGADGKLCAVTWMEMHREDGSLAYTFYPSFLWSLTSDRLITAIPTTKPDC